MTTQNQRNAQNSANHNGTGIPPKDLSRQQQQEWQAAFNAQKAANDAKNKK